ncbi:uncharacterized protein RCC_10971 [Ramularia collo-cygni]|uniref:Uncharacterized protein n=1 Tax=Ramularia collo-cygni TaxID=112498 RepID=A0A2D3VIK9_9PEZI|nr:uncharacterized protein RCC_10971 [Ramularia collo-cygni]CZT25242.1 uncharacterized protein RCC_10971 [Ramularia collo-cygni]
MERSESNSMSPWRYRFSGFCYLCKELVEGALKKHWSRCWKAQRLAVWQKITVGNFDTNDEQGEYILAKDYMRHLIHMLNSLLADGDEGILEAGLVFINKWRYQESRYGNNAYEKIVLSVDTKPDALLHAVAQHILSVFSHHGTSLPVILAIEDIFWAHSRKLDFNEEENIWLLQWLIYSPAERDFLIDHIKQMFLFTFLPRGRPRKSRRVLRKKLCQLSANCRGYEYSTAPWTHELDMSLLRIAREVRSEEERVFAFVAYCYLNNLRWKAPNDILARMRVIGCDAVKVTENDDNDSWKLRRGLQASLKILRPGRRASV